jgi:nicotinamidase-related amidase
MTNVSITNPALMVIDLTNDFLASWETGRRARLIAATNDLVAHFRGKTRPVIWVRQDFKDDLSDAFLEMRDRNVKLNIIGTAGAELDARLETQTVTSQSSRSATARFSAPIWMRCFSKRVSAHW